MYRIAWLIGFLFFTLVISIVQIVLVTEVREAVDVIAKSLSYGSKNTWISKVGEVFSYHRDLAILVVIANAVVYKMVIDRFSGKAAPLLTARFMLITLLVQLLSGFALAYIAFPPAAQALHILFSTLLFSLQFYLYLLVYRTSTYKQ